MVQLLHEQIDYLPKSLWGLIGSNPVTQTALMAILIATMVLMTGIDSYIGSLPATAVIADKGKSMVKKLVVIATQAVLKTSTAIMAGCVANGTVPALSEV
ncbi:MAG: hypothetical protein V4749_14330 [Pseudomonadota bacterium]